MPGGVQRGAGGAQPRQGALPAHEGCPWLRRGQRAMARRALGGIEAPTGRPDVGADPSAVPRGRPAALSAPGRGKPGEPRENRFSPIN